MKTCRTMLLLVANFAALSVLAQAQAYRGPEVSSSAAEITAPAKIEQIESPYSRPSQGTMLRNYTFDAFGPYPIVGAAVVAGIGQMDNTVPEWKQGAAGYSRRFGSDLGIAAISTTSRYALSEVFKEDTLYYRCECTGVFPRLSHAVVSTFTARRGRDGHRAFSISGVVAPYAGTMTAVYAWYPDNYGTRYALRTGNYNLLISAGQNILLEFFYSGPHSLLSRMHLNNGHGAPDSGSR